jgi:hypothetical protein
MLAHRASADLLSRMEAAPLRERWDPTPFRRSCHSAGVNDGGRRFPLKTAKSRGRSPRLCPYEHLPARRLRAEIDEVFASSGNLAEAIEQVARSGRAAVVADGVGGGADVLGKGTSPWHANHEGDCVEAPAGTSRRIYYCVAHDVVDDRIAAMPATVRSLQWLPSSPAISRQSGGASRHATPARRSSFVTRGGFGGGHGLRPGRSTGRHLSPSL